MNKQVMEDIPKWDVALEAVALEQFRKLGRPLGLDDFKQLANEFKIRFDDLMHSLSQLVEHNMWSQQGEDDRGNRVPDEMLDGLFVYNRLDEKIAIKYSVVWQPLAKAYP
ncbi:MAG TPA: hypothetical protein ENI65_04515 [Gammaproteobacteria bacterium]|nr:hypothetical protein [Gammaproteobacteria bacterium]